MMDLVSRAIERIRHYADNSMGMKFHVAFSGGKDSIVLYDLVKRSGVDFKTEYQNTTVDPPDLIYFIRENYPDVVINQPKMTMWQLIPKKLMPPTRMVRYCCEYLKEDAGNGCIVLTGIRAKESFKRSKRKMFEPCMKKRNKWYLNPIIDWTDEKMLTIRKERGLETKWSTGQEVYDWWMETPPDNGQEHFIFMDN